MCCRPCLEIADLEPLSDLPGDSLLEIARNQPDETTRTVFSEYHHMGMLNAGFMLKRGNYKLCHYVGNEPQLFNVAVDPLENDDLAPKPEYAAKRSEMGSCFAWDRQSGFGRCAGKREPKGA